jgi:hypothetical protein
VNLLLFAHSLGLSDRHRIKLLLFLFTKRHLL